MNGKHETVWCIGPEPSGQIMSIHSEGIARYSAEKYPETIYFFADLGEVGREVVTYDDYTMLKVKILKESRPSGYLSPAWSWACNMCTFKVYPDLQPGYADQEVIEHLTQFHDVDPNKIKIVYKEQE